LEAKDLFVFRGNFTVDFCLGINIFIGGTGTGKITLVKELYWTCEFFVMMN
jgi:predicted ATPase